MVAPKKKQPTLSLIDELLAEQSLLQTPVARAAEAFDGTAVAERKTKIFADLIPLSAPQPGEQYAFQVDLDSCTGCKACVSACHSLNGLDENETWRDVGLVSSPDARRPFTQTITTACHHCADPACLNGCPVLAYEKDPITGIVRHLDDQCIGCSYCVLMCPYDVPKYNEARGIVRKCDMCHGRLSEGEAPACVQACPTQAISIVTVTTHVNGRLQADTSSFLAAAPDPSITLPTTRYVTKRVLPENLFAADAAVIEPQPPHWPLVAMLMLMPMAVGCGVADKILGLPTPVLGVCGWLAGAAGLALSVFHLGQPLRAWRVFLGLRKSWLSREAVIFGAWFGLATAYLAIRLGWLPLNYPPLRTALAAGTAALGMLGLFCSVMIYVDTKRDFWRFANTAPRFFGSAIVLGLASALAAPGAPRVLGVLLAGAVVLKLIAEARAIDRTIYDRDLPLTPARKTSLLLTRAPLRSVNELRIAAAGLGGILLPLMIAAGSIPVVAAWPGLLLVALGELAERYLFFRAVVAPKMPGANHA
ncbi:MAG TPA: DmsC/YnfH family molybdoenzyme membrane anchor subunit [Opitutaceae bacterium]|nr:DmsC/YnfH family molybdoenzyme membrane anchor subunit [Opitutaceae bacterium]